MPKSNRSGGARAPKNFDPRYGQKAKKAAGSIGRTHRGYRDADATDAPKKARWTASDRAGRDEARAISTGRPRRDDRTTRGDLRDTDARPARRSFDDRGSRFARDERPARDGRPARDERGSRFGRDERSVRDERGSRFGGAERPVRDGRPARDERGSRFGGAERPARDGRPARDERGSRFGGAERPVRDGRPARDERGSRFGRDDRGSGFDRDERSVRDERGARFGGAERPVRDGRPARDERGSRFGRDDRGSGFDRDERSVRDERGARFGGAERPARDDRGSRFGRDDRGSRFGGAERPVRDGRPARDDRGARFGRNERPVREGRPARDERGSRFGRDERPARRDERPRADRFDRNAAPTQRHDELEDVVHERLQAQAVTAGDVADVTFDSLGLGQNIVRVLAEFGAEKPFPIQAATIPVILEGRDTLGRGRTGSGKTIAFGAPLVEAILRSKAGVRREFGRAPSALILAPTRELALQIDRTIQPIARSVGLFTTQIYGGVPQGRQVGALKKGVDIVIGTPGRVEDLMQQGKLDLSQVQIAVLDEGDHMCELGFLEPVQRILRATAPGSQKLLFSATLDREVESLVQEFLVNPAVYEVAGEDQDSGTIDHRVLVIEHRDKADILTSLVDRDGKTVVFTRTRAYAEMLAEAFEDAGVNAVALHGDLNQAKRTRNLHKLSSGRANVLVATDVAARGIHVDDVDLVIQADAPDEYKTYLHRSGRTGRAGRAGTVVTLITRARRRRFNELLARAEINAPFLEAGAQDDVIDELAGRTLSLQDLTSERS